MAVVEALVAAVVALAAGDVGEAGVVETHNAVVVVEGAAAPAVV